MVADIELVGNEKQLTGMGLVQSVGQDVVAARFEDVGQGSGGRSFVVSGGTPSAELFHAVLHAIDTGRGPTGRRVDQVVACVVRGGDKTTFLGTVLGKPEPYVVSSKSLLTRQR